MARENFPGFKLDSIVHCGFLRRLRCIFRWAAGCFAVSGFIVACSENGSDAPAVERLFTDDTVAVDELPWPDSVSKLPSCDASFGEFSEPVLSAPSGEIVFRPSALLQPVGAAERIELTVLSAAGGGTDTSYNGEITIDAGPAATVLSSVPADEGTAFVTVRFDAPGLHRLTAIVPSEGLQDGIQDGIQDGPQDVDERTGAVEMWAFTPQLPLVEMTVDDGDLARILNDPYEKIFIPAVLSVDGETYPSTVRLHGGSSRDYPKKSFRFDLEAGYMLPDTHDHIIFRAEWNDKSLLRNYLSLETFRNGTWLPTPRVEPVHFRVNQRYYGVMWRQERIGGDFLRLAGLNHETGSLYEADPFPVCVDPGGDLGPLPSMDDYRCVYDEQKGTLDYADLIDLIEGTLLLPPSEFDSVINDVVNVNDLLVYYAVMAVIQNHDHLKKNYYLYRDPSAQDGRWTIFPWDLELTFGHLWTEADDVLAEEIFTDEPLDFGVCPGYCNVLLTRLLEIDEYRERFLEMVSRLADRTFTSEFVDDRIENFLCRATPDILADTNKRAANAEYLDRVDELRFFQAARQTYISGSL